MNTSKILPFEIQKKPTVEETHTRGTYLIRNDLLERLDELSAGKARGFKTFIVNSAIEQLLVQIENDTAEEVVKLDKVVDFVPSKKVQKATFEMDAELHHWLKLYATRNKLNMVDVVEEVLRDFRLVHESKTLELSEEVVSESPLTDKNPITVMREKHGLTKTQLAMIANVDVMTVNRIERGEAARLSGKMLTAVRALGEDEKPLIEQYVLWREEKAKMLKNGV